MLYVSTFEYKSFNIKIYVVLDVELVEIWVKLNIEAAQPYRKKKNKTESSAYFMEALHFCNPASNSQPAA